MIHSENFRKYFPALSGREPQFAKNPLADWILSEYELVEAHGREKILRKKT
ncbi:MAG: hypothetical protein HY652_04910 [Acidobacteria bacterium]|nr:hypothetical protein [Acidobacteriota bacterium]